MLQRSTKPNRKKTPTELYFEQVILANEVLSEYRWQLQKADQRAYGLSSPSGMTDTKVQVSAGQDAAFTRRLEKHLGRLNLLDVGYCKAFYDPFIELHKDTEYSKIATISVDAPDAEIHYTLDGSTPTEASPVYTGPGKGQSLRFPPAPRGAINS